MVDTDLLSSFITNIASCKICYSNVVVTHKLDEKQGFAHNISVKCCKDSCSWSEGFWTSKKIKTPKGRPPFDINMWSVIAFREIGKGHTAMQKFGGFMNMPSVLTQNSYAGLVTNIQKTYTKVAKASMLEAADEIRMEKLEGTYDTDNLVDIDISADGAWQRRGFASLNGVVTIIGVDVAKCIDYEVLTKACKACQVWEIKKGTMEYDNFMASHDCPINHSGSASSMEQAGVVSCFKRSISDYKVRYTSYIGDGDSSSFSSLCKADPYGGVTISKKECVGHVQKRLGSRLRTLKKKMGKTPLKDGKPIGGTNRLTDKMMNKMQCYFGQTIRANTDSVYLMKKGIWAILWHCSEDDKDTPGTRHQFCPRGDDTWCSYWKASNSGSLETYKEKVGLPDAIKKILKPIFVDLTKDELLLKCVHGLTQNNNESINNVIWKRVPKDIYVGREVLEMGVASAVINYNQGLNGICNVYNELSMEVGKFTESFLKQFDTKRVNQMNKKSSDTGKLRRKKLRAIRKGYQDKAVETEGETYASGEFS